MSTMQELAALYAKGINIMQYLRDRDGVEQNTPDMILRSYELQAGTYVKYSTTAEGAAFLSRNCPGLAELLDRYSPESVLEAGVGEATTLTGVLRHMRRVPRQALGFDISWSRVAVGHAYARAQGVRPMPDLFVAEMGEIPLADNSVDVVYTSQSLESNRGRERELLTELYRVARRSLIITEFSNELGGEPTRQRMEKYGYCLDLEKHARALGFRVIEHRLFASELEQDRQNALVLIEKAPEAKAAGEVALACPICHTRLRPLLGGLFCESCLQAYPTIGAIACLRRMHAVLAVKGLEVGGEPAERERSAGRA